MQASNARGSIKSGSVDTVWSVTPDGKRALVEFGRRVRAARDARTNPVLKQETLASDLGINAGYVSKLENGKLPTPPAEKLVIALADYFELNADELLIILLPALKKIPERLRDRLQVLTKTPPAPSTEGRFPVFGLASCGPAVEAVLRDKTPTGEERMTEPWPRALEELSAKSAKRAFVVIAEGDSMEPTIQAGDELLVDPKVKPANGQIALVYWEGSVRVKRWSVDGGSIIVLSSDNTKYAPKSITKAMFDKGHGIALRVVLIRRTVQV